MSFHRGKQNRSRPSSTSGYEQKSSQHQSGLMQPSVGQSDVKPLPMQMPPEWKESWIIWSTSKKTPTQFSQMLMDQMRSVDEFHDVCDNVIKHLNAIAEPKQAAVVENRAQPKVAVQPPNEKDELIGALRDLLPTYQRFSVSSYLNDVIAMREKEVQLQDNFVRQVALFGIKPLKDFMDDVYPRIRSEFAKLLTARKAYDEVREKQRGEEGRQEQRALDATMNRLKGMLWEMPLFEKVLVKAMDDFGRCEAELCKQRTNLVRDLTGPMCKTRWLQKK